MVRVTLVNNESRYVLRASTGPSAELISLDVYPEDDDLLEVERPAGGGQTDPISAPLIVARDDESL